MKYKILRFKDFFVYWLIANDTSLNIICLFLIFLLDYFTVIKLQQCVLKENLLTGNFYRSQENNVLIRQISPVIDIDVILDQTKYFPYADHPLLLSVKNNKLQETEDLMKMSNRYQLDIESISSLILNSVYTLSDTTVYKKIRYQRKKLSNNNSVKKFKISILLRRQIYYNFRLDNKNLDIEILRKIWSYLPKKWHFCEIYPCLKNNYILQDISKGGIKITDKIYVTPEFLEMIPDINNNNYQEKTISFLTNKSFLNHTWSLDDLLSFQGKPICLSEKQILSVTEGLNNIEGEIVKNFFKNCINNFIDINQISISNFLKTDIGSKLSLEVKDVQNYYEKIKLNLNIESNMNKNYVKPIKNKPDIIIPQIEISNEKEFDLSKNGIIKSLTSSIALLKNQMNMKIDKDTWNDFNQRTETLITQKIDEMQKIDKCKISDLESDLKNLTRLFFDFKDSMQKDRDGFYSEINKFKTHSAKIINNLDTIHNMNQFIVIALNKVSEKPIPFYTLQDYRDLLWEKNVEVQTDDLKEKFKVVIDSYVEDKVIDVLNRNLDNIKGDIEDQTKVSALEIIDKKVDLVMKKYDDMFFKMQKMVDALPPVKPPRVIVSLLTEENKHIIDNAEIIQYNDKKIKLGPLTNKSILNAFEDMEILQRNFILREQKMDLTDPKFIKAFDLFHKLGLNFDSFVLGTKLIFYKGDKSTVLNLKAKR